MLTQDDLKNLLAIISRPQTQIGAHEAVTFALLQQKLGGMLGSQDGTHSPHEPEAVSAPEPETGSSMP